MKPKRKAREWYAVECSDGTTTELMLDEPERGNAYLAAVCKQQDLTANEGCRFLEYRRIFTVIKVREVLAKRGKG